MRAYLDLEVERRQGRDAGDAEPVGLARHDGEHLRGALRVGGVAGPGGHVGAVGEPAAAVDEPLMSCDCGSPTQKMGADASPAACS